MSNEQEQNRAEYLRSLLDAARPKVVYENTEWITNAEIPQALALWDERHSGLKAAVEASAERDAKRAEGDRATSGNKFLRDFAKTGEDPLDWSWLGPIPVKIDRKRKCRFDSITTDLIEDAADYHEAKAEETATEARILVGVFRAMARAARRQGMTTIAGLGDGSTVDLSRWRAVAADPDVIDGEVIDDDGDDE